jgi:hypothetical protein
MGTGLQRAYAATHGLELGATYRAKGWRAQTRTLLEVDQTRRGTAMALYQAANGARHWQKLATFAKWAKAAERVGPHLAEL